MKNLFSRMSFPRAVVLFCSLGSLVLGALVYTRTKRLTQVEAQLEDVRDIVKEIQTDAYRLDDLQTHARSDKFRAQSEPLAYIRSVGGGENVNTGSLDIDTSEKPQRNYRDLIYTVTPTESKRKYPRLQIGNFLFRLEEGSPRMKVTRIKLTPTEKIAPGEIGKDQWTFEIQVTTRTKLETAPPAGG